MLCALGNRRVRRAAGADAMETRDGFLRGRRVTVSLAGSQKRTAGWKQPAVKFSMGTTI